MDELFHCDIEVKKLQDWIVEDIFTQFDLDPILKKYAPIITSQEIDGRTLCVMTDQDLQQLQFTLMGRERLLGNSLTPTPILTMLRKQGTRPPQGTKEDL